MEHTNGTDTAVTAPPTILATPGVEPEHVDDDAPREDDVLSLKADIERLQRDIERLTDGSRPWIDVDDEDAPFDRLVEIWFSYREIITDATHPHVGKRGFLSKASRRSPEHLFLIECLESGFVTHWREIEAIG